MSYTDFDIPRVEKELGLKVRSRLLSWQVEFIEPSKWLVESLERGSSNALVSEKSRSEFLVAPVLLAVKEVNDNRLQVFSGQTLNVDANLGLTGECDFILSKTEPTPVLREPIMAVVEAKKNDIELGLGQCIAQMFAAKIFNTRRENNFREIFGCVTTGETWQFLKLEDDFAIVDTNRYFISEVGKILGVLNQSRIFTKVKMQLARVIGNLVSTIKNESLEARKLLIVQTLNADLKPTGKPMVALDSVGAGVGELVFWCRGKEASFPFKREDTPTDCTIVGIVDSENHVYNNGKLKMEN